MDYYISKAYDLKYFAYITSLITLPMLSPSWPKCVAHLAVAQLDCRPVVCRSFGLSPRWPYTGCFSFVSKRSMQKDRRTRPLSTCLPPHFVWRETRGYAASAVLSGPKTTCRFHEQYPPATMTSTYIRCVMRHNSTGSNFSLFLYTTTTQQHGVAEICSNYWN